MNKSFIKSKEMRSFSFVLACTFFIFCLFFINNTFVVLGGGLFLFLCIAFISFNAFLKITRLSFEAKFKEKEKEALVEYLHDGIIVYDTNFTIKTFNRAAESLFGVSREIVLNKKMEPGLAGKHELKPLIQVLFPSLAPVAAQKSDPGTWPQIVTISLDFPKLELETILNQVTTEDGDIIGFLKVIKDNTREKSVLAAKTDFINVAAHQLRTPVTALHWALENIVEYSKGNETIYPIAKEALSVANRATKITNDLLDISKIEEGRFGYTFKESDLIPFLKKISDDLKSLADFYSVSIQFESFSDSVIVYIDENRLSAVFLNIIDNAIRYNTKNGRVLVSVFPIESKPYIKITISDTGIGIPQADLQKLFQKLHRGSNVVQMEPNGSGLGLYIAKNIVEQHGGKIEVYSEINKGTTFSILIPTDKTLVPQRELSKVGFRL